MGGERFDVPDEFSLWHAGAAADMDGSECAVAQPPVVRLMFNMSAASSFVRRSRAFRGV